VVSRLECRFRNLFSGMSDCEKEPSPPVSPLPFDSAVTLEEHNILFPFIGKLIKLLLLLFLCTAGKMCDNMTASSPDIIPKL